MSDGASFDHLLIFPNEMGERGETITTARCHRCSKNSRVGEVWKHPTLGYVFETLARASRRRQAAQLWGVTADHDAVANLSDWSNQQRVIRLAGFDLVATCVRQGHRVGISHRSITSAVRSGLKTYATVDPDKLTDAPIALLVAMPE